MAFVDIPSTYAPLIAARFRAKADYFPSVSIPRVQQETHIDPWPKVEYLIADDNAANVELLEVFLSEIDCEIAVGGRRFGHLGEGGQLSAGPHPAGHYDAEAERV